MNQMEKEKPIFFPGLNGLRAIAALGVVLSHITVELEQFGLNPHIIGTKPSGGPRGLDLADFGVTMFFALSGFLITFLLLAENKRHPIKIKDFYMRRILRIWPLYYIYFLIAMALTWFWQQDDQGGMVFFYIFFAANIPKILSMQIPLLSHYWSLGVEEQFYAFWPWAVKKNIPRLFFFTMAFLILFLLLKVFVHEVFPGSYLEMAMYVLRFDCMMIGALGAILYYRKNELLIRVVSHVGVQAAAWAAIILVAFNRFHIVSLLDHEIIAGVTVALILGQITAKRKIFNLDNEAFDFLGKISYGIYVIHPLVMAIGAKLLGPVSFGPDFIKYIVAYAGVTGVTILLAHLSYEHVEKRFLRLKGRYSTVKSAGTKHYQEEAEEAEVSALPRSS
ncbi:MAG: acyltransferase [Saprospirales bacterium]|nr:acyltransferase [Saprospirales bacterium]